MEFVKTILGKLFTKEKVTAYAIMGALALAAAGAGVNSPEVKKMICENQESTKQ